MSQGARSDQPLPQQPGEFNNDPAIQQLINERNSLRSQNDQLWKIVEKQRGIMQNLQKDLARVTTERDQLRQANPQENTGNIPTPAQTPSSSSLSDLGQAHGQGQEYGQGQAQEQPNSHAQANGYSQSQYNEQQQQPHSRRSPERRPYDADPNPEQFAANGEREPELASGFNPNSSFSSTTSSTDHRQHQHQQHRNHHSEHQSPRHHGLSHRPPALPLTPPSNSEGEYEGSRAEIGQEDRYNNGQQQYDQYQHHSSQAEGDMGSRDPYDQEVQAATAGHRAQHYQGSPTYPERDTRAMEGYAPNTLPPRNISGSIAIAPHLMPHVPPRSPRRERKDDHNISPHASDNEDEYYQGSKKNAASGAPTSSRARGEYSPEHHTQEGREPHSRMPAKQNPAGELDAPQSALLSGPIPTSPAPTKVTFLGLPNSSGRKPANLTPQALNPLDYGPTSPTGVNHTSTPTSPIHTIIDQDAEKFRMFMNKNAPSRKVAQGTNNAGFDGQDHATSLQAVAMDNIHSQMEPQHQHPSQHHSGHSGHQMHPHEQWTGPNSNSDALSNPESHHHHHTQDSWMDQPSSQMPLPPEIRDRKRQSSLPIIEGYPRIGARSTSHQRAAEDDDYPKEYTMPQPPRRYDSHPMMDNQVPAPLRTTSPTPSGNSSVTNAPSSSQPSGHSRSGPTLHQQAFHMFGDNLDSVSILVVGSGIKVNDKGREILMFFVSVGREVVDNAGPSPHREEDELWRVEKQYIDFVNLDSKLRITQSRNVVNNLPRLPDKSLFSTNAPSKADARKVALEQYMQQLTSIRFKDTRDLCEFLRIGLVERGSRKEGKEAGWKEGYLTKRGKNFGGWKTRFFVLRGPVLEYFDTKDGHHLGSIALTYAQIGRQQAQDKQDGGDGTNDPNSYRHAFLILEPKKGQTVADAKRNPNSVMRHVLCAETDEERDEWVEALLVHVGKEAVEQAEPVEKERVGRRMPEIQKVSATPIKELASSKGNEKLLLNQEAYERQQRTVPGSPSAQQFIAHGRGGNVPQSPTLASTSIEDRHSQERQSAEGQYPSSRSNYKQYNDQDQQQQQQRNQSSQSQSQAQEEQTAPAPAPAPAPQLTPDQVAEKEKKQRSRMTFHWPKKSTKDEGPIQLPQATQQPTAKEPAGTTPASSSQSSGLRSLLGMGGGTNNVPPQGANGQGVHQSSSSIRQVFGVSLEQAIEQAIVQPGYQLPAVVYRCIEYLNAHNAKMEEGIYRLNGSATIIKNLKDRFNQEGDVPLLSHDEYYDIHAIAGLLKLFLRELPSSVLTRELHKEFLQVIELTNRSDRVGELTRLVASLPEANYTILRALTAHLIEIVDNSDVNKMTARNVGIVFSPTLGISAGVFALLMSDFDQIFHTNDGRIMPLENSGMRNVGDPNALLDA